MINYLYDHLRRTNKPVQRVHFNINDLEDFTELNKTQQKLLVAMIRRVRTTTDPNSLIDDANYKVFGYDSRQNFYRDKSVLEARGFIITEGKQYFICLHKVMCSTKAYYNDMMVYFGLKPGIVMSKFHPDPNFIPKPPKNVSKK